MARLQARAAEQTAVIETAGLVWRTGRPPMARLHGACRADGGDRNRGTGVGHLSASMAHLQGCVEQMMGIEPILPVRRTGVPPMTLHLLGGLRGDLVIWIVVGAGAAFDDPSVGRVGIEPT